MNNYDYINTFLNSEPNIESDFEFLMSYINKFLYKYQNREKLDDFYKRIPGILDKILGVSLIKQKGLTTKETKSELDILSHEDTTYKDFDKLLHLILPDFENYTKNSKNLFSSINMPPDHILHYTLPVSIISKSISNLVNEKKFEYVLGMSFFNISAKNLDIQMNELIKGHIHISLLEYFFFLLLISIKENSSKQKVNLINNNKDFKSVKKNPSSAYKVAFSDYSKAFIDEIDYNKSIVFNFYSILFKQILDYFSMNKHPNDILKLKILITIVECVFLSEYYIPDSSCISKSPADIYTHFFSKESTRDTFATTFKNFFKLDKSSQVTIPNPIVLNTLKQVVITLQRETFLYKENRKNISLDTDSMLFIIQKPLFYFFKSCFRKLTDGSSSSCESNLGDVSEIWFCYITPWMRISRYSGAYDEAIKEYIYFNILFYTELFNDYIIAFSSLNILNKYEIKLLNDILNCYKIKNKNEILEGHVELRNLEDLANGKIYVSWFFILESKYFYTFRISC